MRQLILLTCLILLLTSQVDAQAIGSEVDVVRVYSENGLFYLKSTPYDNEFPSLPGKTLVYAKGNPTPLYSIDRGFDSVESDSNNLILSNDGEVVFFAIPWSANETVEGLKSVTIYRRGEIIKSFTETDVNGCDKTKERCSLVYSNYKDVVDMEKSNFGSEKYHKVFHAGVDEQERFLSDFAIFSSGDLVYLTDSKKTLHVFDLKTAEMVSTTPFASVFQQIKNKGRFTKTELTSYNAPTFLDFPNLRNGQNSYAALGRLLDMSPAFIDDKNDDQYKQYRFKINADILSDGSLEIKGIEFLSSELPKEQILKFFKQNKFDRRAIPRVFDKWSLGDEYFSYRKKNAALARREREEERKEERLDFEKRLMQESIDGIYIPKDLGECLVELDKTLSEIDKREMKALGKREEMILYHMGLGLWIRNNWSLWGGSRLQKYFTDRSVGHPDEMSSIILFHYYDWLHDKKDTWKDWEKDTKHR